MRTKTGTILILLGLALIPVLFYTYNGVFGHSPDWVNISIFYLAAAGAFLLESSPHICNTVTKNEHK